MVLLYRWACRYKGMPVVRMTTSTHRQLRCLSHLFLRSVLSFKCTAYLSAFAALINELRVLFKKRQDDLELFTCEVEVNPQLEMPDYRLTADARLAQARDDYDRFIGILDKYIQILKVSS